MKKWDMLFVHIVTNDVYCEIDIDSTGPQHAKSLADRIVQEGFNYFSYVATAARHKLSFRITEQSVKGHLARVWINPCHTAHYTDNIRDHDIRYFVLNLVSEDGWLPYPGNGDGERFIKYLE